MSDLPGNEELVRLAWDALVPGQDLGAISDFFADDYVRHSSDGGTYTRQDFRGVLEALHSAFPDLLVEIEDIVASGDRVAYRWRSTGTHRGEYFGVPPTHQRIVATGITFAQVRDGKLAEEWASWNKVSVLHNLGIIPIDMP